MDLSYPKFEHSEHPDMFAQVVLASEHETTGKSIYTIHLRYPRMIHSEIMTHRVFCRNARSSRAVPIKTMLEEIRETPFVPWHWTKIQKGMQGEDGWNEPVQILGAAALHIDPERHVSNEAAWLWGRDMMCDLAESFANAGYHKQVVNRLIEPWMWIDVLVTSTEWANFFHLREDEAAEPHIRDLARLIHQAIDNADCQILAPGEWHLPYITDEDREYANNCGRDELPTNILCEISAARCARISYRPFDGNPSYEREFERYKGLVGGNAIHASPLEHQAAADDLFDRDDDGTMFYAHPDLSGPLNGFIQFRKLIPGECVNDR